MNINDFVTANASMKYTGVGAKTSSPAAGKVVSAATTGLEKAEKRIQIQVDATNVQLSSLGKLKSSVSGVQFAARALGSLSATTTSAAEKTAAAGFVTAFNSALGTAKATAAVPGEMVVTSSANRTNKGLQNAINADQPTLEALKKIGFSVGKDGTLALDSKKLEAAQKTDATGVRATLVKIGKLVDETASKELAADGNVGLSFSALNLRSGALKSQQITLAALKSMGSS